MQAKLEGGLPPLLKRLAKYKPAHRKWVMTRLKPTVRRTIAECWPGWAHAGQAPEAGLDWRIWMLLAGRGYGKTRAGAEWISELARHDGDMRLALVGATVADVRRVMIEGKSGLLAVARDDEKPQYIASKGEVHFDSGAVAYIYSASNHEKLRGPEHHHAWCDELAKWENAESCWDNMMMGLRLGEKPKVFVTTTPRPVPLLRRLVAQEGTILKRGRTHLNRHLPADFIAMIEELYAGTRWARQEVDGELIEDFEGALWTKELIERCRVEKGTVPSGTVPDDQPRSEGQSPCGDSPLTDAATVPGTDFKRIVIGVDPPASAQGDACGIVVAGLGADGRAYVLADHSVERPTPERWARAVAAAAEVWGADRVVAEANNGGDMVISTLRAADVTMPVKKVHAARGKAARAEPVSMLYEAGKVFHAGVFPELEEQMCGLISGGGYEGPSTRSGGRSPDRADALVWALTELMLGKPPKRPRVSVL